jgi:hypothetical protein
MAILREQGVNGQVEMAAAFDRAGFAAVDVHMSDILSGRVSLEQFKGLVACGGFSYGDVLGAGEGWAKSVLFNSRARDAFQGFFERADSFALGVCNGFTPLVLNTPFAFIRAVVAAACIVAVSGANASIPMDTPAPTIPANAVTLGGDYITLGGDYVTLGA